MASTPSASPAASPAVRSAPPLQPATRPAVYGLVAVTAAGKAVYGRPAAKGSVSMKLPGEPLKAVYLVVMGAPAQHKRLSWDNDDPNRQYPYTVTFGSGIRPE
jgi:hypothetical protein